VPLSNPLNPRVVEDPSLNDAAPANVKQVHRFKRGPTAEPGAQPSELELRQEHAENGELELRPGPLHFQYQQTRVVPDALARLQRSPGVVRMDRSALAETFKMLRSQLFQRMRADGHSLLAITSPRHMQDKSLTAVNIALAIAAEMDSTVLLVDADLSGQGLQRLFGLEHAPGLAEHLTQGQALNELLINPGLPRFVLLTAGDQTHLQTRSEAQLHSAELLGTRAAQHLFAELKQRYPDRFVVVDLPPLLDTADALAFLPQADTTLLVIEEQHTAIADIEAANELLARFNLIGAVMAKPRPGTQAAHTGRKPWWRRLWPGKRGGTGT
jgi:protein-tyrosine kinase